MVTRTRLVPLLDGVGLETLPVEDGQHTVVQLVRAAPQRFDPYAEIPTTRPRPREVLHHVRAFGMVFPGRTDLVAFRVLVPVAVAHLVADQWAYGVVLRWWAAGWWPADEVVTQPMWDPLYGDGRGPAMCWRWEHPSGLLTPDVLRQLLAAAEAGLG